MPQWLLVRLCVKICVINKNMQIWHGAVLLCLYSLYLSTAIGKEKGLFSIIMHNWLAVLLWWALDTVQLTFPSGNQILFSCSSFALLEYFRISKATFGSRATNFSICTSFLHLHLAFILWFIMVFVEWLGWGLLCIHSFSEYHKKWHRPRIFNKRQLHTHSD